ncbi:MAG TPA: hypothetical protein PKM06_03185 [Bacillota bacterium]|nr:hypothetical protein [Peptococcaceae bacterium MAG4]NLW39236.1 hypothetical protein [Peptococcaceae bacterium]HQD75594.1 hypothetical protein [Bacillota bacterium]HUM58209.1 hypothetical protein [Bacillota bacterium]
MGRKANHSEQIVYQLNKIIIPFSYTLDSKDAVEMILNPGDDSKPDWIARDLNTDRLFNYISRLIHGNNEWEETIGHHYVMSEDGRIKYNLPLENQLVYMVRRKKEYYYMRILQVELFLFETQVGFLVYDIEHLANPAGSEKGYPFEKIMKAPDLSVDTVIDANCFSKSLKRKRDLEFKYYKKDELVTLQLASATSKIIECYGVDSYFEHEMVFGEQLVPSTALVYSALILGKSFLQEEDWQEKLGRLLFFMRRAIKPSYKPAPQEFDLENNPNVLRFFENSYWGISTEGLNNIVYLVDDNTTNEFMTTGYQKNLQNSYYYIYILALHQRFALLNFCSRVGSRSGNNILNMRKRIADFRLRSVFQQVSNVDHQDVLYRRIRKILGIEEMLHELHFELEILADLSVQEEQRKESIFQKFVMIL